jgi:hypothetical protein
MHPRQIANSHPRFSYANLWLNVCFSFGFIVLSLCFCPFIPIVLLYESHSTNIDFALEILLVCWLHWKNENEYLKGKEIYELFKSQTPTKSNVKIPASSDTVVSAGRQLKSMLIKVQKYSPNLLYLLMNKILFAELVFFANFISLRAK